MTRVIHTADTHIGYRQYHSPERRRDFLDAFERVVEDAVDEGVDAVVHGGDVFHDRRPDLPDLLGTIGALRELAAADVPFLAVVGNHEDKREAQWLDLFEELDLATRLDADGTTVGSTTFYGLDYVPRSQRDDLDHEYAPPEGEHAALVAHGLFEPFAHADWDTAELLAEATVDFDALLLGDNHHPDTAQVEGTWVTYAGSTERVSAAEEADRGYNLVTFGVSDDESEARQTESTGDGVDVARRGLPTREFVFVDVELHGDEGVERVRERVREHDVEDAVVHVRVDGDGEPFAPAAVEEFVAERGALVARVTDRRELADDDADLDVHFADPDEVVRERVREMGLSAAARDVDETVRASDLADSNVRDAVSDRVADLLDEDPDAFEPADDEGPADGGEATRDDEAAEDNEVPDQPPADDHVADDDEGAAEASPDATAHDDVADPDEDGDDGAEDAPTGQASVEEFL